MSLIDTSPDLALLPPMGETVSPQGVSHLAAFVELVGQIAPIDIDPAEVTRDSTLAGDLMLDSISLISLMALTEAHFGVALSEQSEAVANLRTVGAALDLLARLGAAQA